MNRLLKPIRKDYPTTGVLKLAQHNLLLSPEPENQEGLPDYWGIETSLSAMLSSPLFFDQEGLPDYWGIETISNFWIGAAFDRRIRKDYPTTGVLKLYFPRIH